MLYVGENDDRRGYVRRDARPATMRGSKLRCHSTTAVSYTHLDVYKRQARTTARLAASDHRRRSGDDGVRRRRPLREGQAARRGGRPERAVVPQALSLIHI